MSALIPTSHQALVQLLQSLLREATTPNATLPELPADLQSNLLDLAEQFPALLFDLLEKREALQHFTLRMRELEKRLRMLIRFAAHAVKRHHQLDPLPAQIIEVFDLQANGVQPKYFKHIKAPVEVAQSLLKANEVAQDRGFEILIDPSPQTIQAVIDALVSVKSQHAQAYGDERARYASFQTTRVAVKHLLMQIRTFVRMRFVGKSHDELRAALRALGFPLSARRDQAAVA